MKVALLNTVWWLSLWPSWARYRTALTRPQWAQAQLLREYLRVHAGTDFGRRHQFKSLRNVDDFRTAVPIHRYEDLAPYIERVAAGEAQVLTADRVTHLEPTSGTTTGTRLFPYTARLQREFSRAVGPWLHDLYRSRPAMLGGPSYWSISPVMQAGRRSSGGLPIGFAEDTSYLGGWQKRLVDATQAVPGRIARVTDLETFRYLTLLSLLRRPDLTLISVWHPSFLGLLLDALPGWFECLQHDVRHGTAPLPGWQAPPQPQRFMPGPEPARLWPRLQLVSCWADGPAAGPARALRARLPGVELQPKGLLATEAFVTIPFEGQHPLALRSHFFEFVDATGVARLAHELEAGGIYSMVVTTGGGLWRYSLPDLVEVTGFVQATPSLRFLGKSDKISDLRGEKLHEAFVNAVFTALFETPPAFVLLAPDGDGYTCYVEGGEVHAERLEQALEENFHYRYAIRLGQLKSVRVYRISSGGARAYQAFYQARGQRLGDIKPAALSLDSGWSERFPGSYC